MKFTIHRDLNFFVIFILVFAVASCAGAAPEIRTPKTPDAPHVNGPDIFGVRPGSPFLYSIPATGKQPLQFSVDNLPIGLQLDANTGRITGALTNRGEYAVIMRVKNVLGAAEKKFRIVVGDEIALAPAMGWNAWNCWESKVDQEKVLTAAKMLVSSGLNQHGWVYVNIDDAWQGKRGGPFNAIQPNERFPDIKGLADAVHGMGLKIGIYSGPFTTSYAGFCGGSSDNEDGSWQPLPKGQKNLHLPGKYSFSKQDARQWAVWQMDYLKYDGNLEWIPQIAEMSDALKSSGRDVIFSLSNSAKFDHAAEYAKLANSWRTTGDIRETWARMIGLGRAQVKWAPFARPGHRNDPDMLIVGHLFADHADGGHPTALTPDEQYTHITLWVLLGAPLLLNCDLTRLDAFTLGLLSNDEVLAVDQDTLGNQALPIGGKDNGTNGVVYAKLLEDGTHAVGFINETESSAAISVKWPDLKISGEQTVRDLWRQRDLGKFADHFEMQIAPHGAELFKIGTPESQK